MDKPTVEQQIEYLICRKFPIYPVIRKPAPLGAQGHRLSNRAEILKEVEAYKDELSIKALNDELESLYEQEREKEAGEQEKKRERELLFAQLGEQKRFFNQPHADGE